MQAGSQAKFVATGCLAFTNLIVMSAGTIYVKR